MQEWFTTLEAWLTQIPEPIGTLVNYTLVFLLLAFLFVLPLVTFTVLIERKVIGFMQHRFGPNRVGPRGWLQTIADAIKLIQKEDITPKAADPLPFWLAPIVVFVPTFISFAVIGFGGHWVNGTREVGTEVLRDFKMWAPVDLNVGVVLILAMSSLAGIGVFMAGWASNNKYSIFGSMRGVAQIISYEVPMILTILAVVLMTGSMSLKDIAMKQGPRFQPYYRDYAVQYFYPQQVAVSQSALDAQLMEEAPGFAATHAAPVDPGTVEIGTDTRIAVPEEWTPENAPIARVSTQGGYTTIRIGANINTVGPLPAGVDLTDPDRTLTPLEELALKVVPPGYDPAYTQIETAAPTPIQWRPVTFGIPYLIPMFLGFLIFFITATAETNRAPFDLPEAESELVSGFHTEYTGMKFALFFLGEYAAMILMASLTTIAFLGAWWVPFFMSPLAERFPVIYFFSFFLKMYFLIYVMIWFRSTFPRLRPDQLMDFAWKALLPLSLINLLVVGYFQFSDWNYNAVRQTNYQLWYNNVIAGLDWPVWRALVAALMLPLIPDAFGDHWPRVRKYLTPALWIFSIFFVLDQYLLAGIWRGAVLPHMIVMDVIWVVCIYLFGMALITLADDLAPRKLFVFSLYVLMAIVPVSSIIGYTERSEVQVAAALAWVQAFMWWLVTVPVLLGLYQVAALKQPEKRFTILANEAVPYRPVSLNLGDLKEEVAQGTDLTDLYTRQRPPSLATPAGSADVPDWRTARFPDEEPKGPAAIPGQQEWGPVKPLPNINAR